MPLRTIPAAMSMTECCLTNTVEKQISRAVAMNRVFQPVLRNRLLSQAPKATARAPTVCREGQTLVLVS